MKRLLAIVAVIGLALMAKAQESEIINTGPPTVMFKVDTNSTLIITASGDGQNPVVLNGNQRHYQLLENRGISDIVFDWTASIATTNITVNGVSQTIFVGHLLRPLDTYEIPADKVNNFPISAISTNTSTQGVLAVTFGYHKS